MAILKASCTHFSRLPNPLESDGIKNYYAVVDVDSIFNLAKWREINIRDPKDSGYVPNQIRESLLEQDLFFMINRGLVISAESVQHDNKSNQLNITVSDNQIHGLMDGGHTYLQLEKFKEIDTDERGVEQQFVKVEIITGLDRDEIVNLVDGRNTSNAVKEVSLENLRDKFKGLKKVLDEQPYGNNIAYSEYETFTNSQGKTVPKPISIMDVLKCLVCLDSKTFSDSKHPTQIATRNNMVIDHFRTHSDELEPLYPLVPDFLQLLDTITKNFVSSYNASGGEAGAIGADNNRFFKKRKTPGKLYFTGSTSDWSFADNLRLPVLAAFRAVIKVHGAKRSWKVDDPSKFFNDVVGPKLTSVVCESLKDTQDVTRTSRAESVWGYCYTAADLAVLKL